jgi:hypothetical protein
MSRLILIAVSLACLARLQAQPDDLWNRAQVAYRSSHGFAATSMKVHTDVSDKDGKWLGSTAQSRSLEGWKGDQPVWKDGPVQTQGDPGGFILHLSIGAERLPEKAFKNTGEVTRIGEEAVGGALCVVYQVKGQDSGSDWEGKVWLDRAAARPVKAVYSWPKPRGLDALTATIHFGADPEGCWLPLRTDILARGTKMFITRNLKIAHDYAAWRPRP